MEDWWEIGLKFRPLAILDRLDLPEELGVRGAAVFPAKWGSEFKLLILTSIKGNRVVMVTPAVAHPRCRLASREEVVVADKVVRLVFGGTRYISLCVIDVGKEATIDSTLESLVEEGVVDCVGLECFEADELKEYVGGKHG